MNYTDPSGHGILSKIKSAAKKVTTTVKNTYNKAKTWVKNTYNKAKNWVSNTYQNAKKALTNVVSSSGSSEKNKSGKSSSGGRYSSGGSNAGNRKYSSSSRGSSKSNFYRSSTYERAKSFGQSRYNWFSSKMKESGNIRNSWTKAIEKTVRKFCTTASRIKKDAVKSVKAANIAIGISAITIGKMKLEQLKKKLPNINTLAGGGSEIASVGSSSAISIPVATEGIAIAGTGLAISGSALANMFDVRIQKSESNKGNESGKSTGESGKVDNTLTDAQKSRLNALENTINDHLTDGDFSGTLRDLQGDPVPNGRGGYFDHLGEMQDSYKSLRKIKKALEGSLKNPNLSDVDRALLQEGLNKANSYINKIEELFDPYGGIN